MLQISPIPKRKTGTPQTQLASSNEHRSVLAQTQHRSDDTRRSRQEPVHSLRELHRTSG
jgi:hypothetical protein